MKRFTIKKTILAFFIFCMILGCFGFILNWQFKPKTAYAQVIIDSNSTESENKNIVETIEIELQEQGTNIAEVLQSQRDFYSSELNKSSGKNKENLTAIVGTIDESLAMFGARMQNTEGLPYAFHVSPDCTCNELNYLSGNPCGACVVILK